MEICTYCRKEFENDQIVKTDEFNEYGSEVKTTVPIVFSRELNMVSEIMRLVIVGFVKVP